MSLSKFYQKMRMKNNWKLSAKDSEPSSTPGLIKTRTSENKESSYLSSSKKNAEADAFIKQVNEKKVDELKAEGIQALNWNRVARNEIENQSLFFRDYEA